MSGDGGSSGAYWSKALRLVSHPPPYSSDSCRSCIILDLVLVVSFREILRSWIALANSVAVVAANMMGNGFHPRQMNISSLIPLASSSSFDPASFSSPNPSLDPVPASTLLPQAPADYCGLCVIEAPGGIRLVYWVSVSFQLFPCRGYVFKLLEKSWYTFGMFRCSGLWP